MSIWDFGANLFSSSLDAVLVIAVICTLFVVLVTLYLSRERSTVPQAPQQKERSDVTVKPKIVKRIDSGDGPRHRNSGRRRRREDGPTVSGADQMVAQTASSGVSSASSTLVCSTASVEEVPQLKNAEPAGEAQRHEPADFANSDLQSKSVTCTSSFEQDQVSHTEGDRTTAVDAKQSTRVDPLADRKPEKHTTEPIRTTSQAPAYATAIANGAEDSPDDWHDVNPRRRERQKSRVPPNQPGSGTSLAGAKSESEFQSSVPDPVALTTTTTEIVITGDVQSYSAVLESTASRRSEPDHPDHLSGPHTEHLPKKEESELAEGPTEPDFDVSEKRPATKASKPRRKRRSAVASKPINVIDLGPAANSTVVPSATGETKDTANVAQAEPHRTTPDDSEFELIELSGPTCQSFGGSSVTESNVDTCLGPDWGLAQPIPRTGDIQEFPCLPGAESQFAIVHPADSRTSHLECARHPQAEPLLKSALTEPDDDQYTVGVAGPLIEAQTTAPRAPATSVRQTVKRSKARKAD